MSGLNLRLDERVQLRQALKIQEVKSKVMIPDPNIDDRHRLAEVDLEMVEELFRNEPDSYSADLLQGRVARAKTKLLK